VWSRLHDVALTPVAQARLNAMPMDERVVISCAFRDAITNPEKVGDYKLEFSKLPSGQIMQIHKFRFGFAHFIVLDLKDGVILSDFWLGAEYKIAAD
jgi:hypothetical protein